MANYYCKTSTLLSVPRPKTKQARAIVQRVVRKLEKTDEGCSFTAHVEAQQGGESQVMLYHDESACLEQVKLLVETTINS